MEPDLHPAFRSIEVERNEQRVSLPFVHAHSQAARPAKRTGFIRSDESVFLDITSPSVDDVVRHCRVTSQPSSVLLANSSDVVERKRSVANVLRHYDWYASLSIIALVQHASERAGDDVGYLSEVNASQGAPS